MTTTASPRTPAIVFGQVARTVGVLLAAPFAVACSRTGRIAVALLLVAAHNVAGRLGLVLVGLLAVVVLLGLRACSPRGWEWASGRIVGGWRYAVRYWWWWRSSAERCGLTTKNPDGAVVRPRIVRVVSGAGGDVLRVRLLVGQTPDLYEAKADALAHAWGAVAVRVTSPGPGLVLLRVLRRDTLTRPYALTDVPAALDLRAVPYAIGEDGQWRTRSYANVAGEVGGGVPGSGKTAGETSLACALIQNPCVQYVVVDGKAGDDWSWIRPRAAAFCAEDQNLRHVLAVVDRVHELMRHRLRSQKTERGAANFWDLPPDPKHPAVFLVVDEVQTFTDTKGLSKDQRELAVTITARLAALVKKGRSAGIVTRLLTQKPTADALPTAIRDNSSVRTCWRVMTREAAVAVLGDALHGSPLSPVDIPASMPGVAVVATDRDGDLERVRYPHITPALAEAIAANTAHLRRDLTPVTTVASLEGEAA